MNLLHVHILSLVVVHGLVALLQELSLLSLGRQPRCLEVGLLGLHDGGDRLRLILLWRNLTCVGWQLLLLEQSTGLHKLLSLQLVECLVTGVLLVELRVGRILQALLLLQQLLLQYLLRDVRVIYLVWLLRLELV